MILDLYGLVIDCRTDSPDLDSELVRPFRPFKSHGGRPEVTVIVKETHPPYETFPALSAVFSTPRNVVYKDNALKIIDYFGRGLVVHDEGQRVYRLYSRDRNLLQEIFYLLLLSLFGQFCDRAGLLRIHALALSRGGKAFLLVMPQGGGKSTLALAMLRKGTVKYISDDEPIFRHDGRILPFARPLGIIDDHVIRAFPQEFVYRIDRMEFGPKYYIENDYWKDRIETNPLRDIVILVGCKILNGSASIQTCPKWKVFRALVKNAVIGIGLYQGLEFLLSRSSGELLLKIPGVLKRLSLTLKLVRAAKTYQFALLNDLTQNASVFNEFIQKESGDLKGQHPAD